LFERFETYSDAQLTEWRHRKAVVNSINGIHDKTATSVWRTECLQVMDDVLQHRAAESFRTNDHPVSS
jgi:hypothetical protein